MLGIDPILVALSGWLGEHLCSESTDNFPPILFNDYAKCVAMYNMPSAGSIRNPCRQDLLLKTTYVLLRIKGP